MSAPRPRPRRTNANLRPADVVLAARQTRRSSAEVQKEKAALEAQRQLLIQKREADLEEIHKLELKLEAQAQQHEDHAARPPPVPSTPATGKTGHVPPLASAPSAAATTAPSLPSHAAATDVDSSVSAIQVGPGQATVERRRQPGRSRRITRADVEGHGASGATPAGPEGAGEGAAKELTGGDSTANSAVISKGGKKRKSEGGEEPRSVFGLRARIARTHGADGGIARPKKGGLPNLPGPRRRRQQHLPLPRPRQRRLPKPPRHPRSRSSLHLLHLPFPSLCPPPS